MNDIRPPKKLQRPSTTQSSSQPRQDVSSPPRAKVQSQADIRPPRSTTSPSAYGMASYGPQPSQQATVPSPLESSSKPADQSLHVPKKRSKVKVFLLSLVSIIIILILATAAVFGWYTMSLEPASPGNESRTRIEIASGTSPSEIARLLEEKKLIRSSQAFEIYLRISGSTNKLQAGTYSLSASESTQTIVEHIVAGKVDQFSLTFLPGATLAQNRAQLLAVGYGEAEVDVALKKTYDHPLFATKPETADLEGYIYGETYKFDSSATVEVVLKKTFDHYYEVITKNNLIEGLKTQDLSLYEGITLASIVQREVPSAKDQKQVAQVFLRRLAIGMQLGSDVTYQYAAKKLGVPPTPNLDSPYNTRKYTGLPPGPIATPGLTALQAVAAPAAGDYLFFLSGDDDVTYFGRTDAEHEANIQNHCQKKCLLP